MRAASKEGQRAHHAPTRTLPALWTHNARRLKGGPAGADGARWPSSNPARATKGGEACKKVTCLHCTEGQL